MSTHAHTGLSRFCHRCGQVMTSTATPPKCEACGFVEWADPPVAAVVVVKDASGAVLLARRTSGVVGSGRWSLPGGFVNRGEDVRDAAAREVSEETGIVVAVGDVLHVGMSWDDPAKPTIVIWFSGVALEGSAVAGDDTDEVGWFDLKHLPDLAFENDIEILRGL